MKSLLVALTLLAACAVCAQQQDVIGPVNEGSTASFWVTFCDDARTITDATNCPAGGALVTYSDVTALTYVVHDRATNKPLPNATPVSVSVTANPVKVSVPYGTQVIVGRCSAAYNTACTVDGDCTTGTCEIDKKTYTDGQIHVLTLTATIAGGVQVVERVPFAVRNLEYYP